MKSAMIYPRLQSILSKSFAPPSILNSLCKRRERRFKSVWEDTLSILHISLGLIPNITNKHIWYSFWFNSASCSHGDVVLWTLVETLPPLIVVRNQEPVPLIFGTPPSCPRARKTRAAPWCQCYFSRISVPYRRLIICCDWVHVIFIGENALQADAASQFMILCL